MQTSLKINEERLNKIIKEIVEEVLFNTLPKHDPTIDAYWATLQGTPYIIKEGLIKSYPIENVVHAISEMFNLLNYENKTDKNKELYYLDCGESKYSGIIGLSEFSQNKTKRIEIIVRKNDFNQADFDRYFLKYGWFCSFSNKMEFYKNLIVFIYEKKFDIDVTDAVLEKKYIYHICPNIYLNKINLKGLVPKFSSWNIYYNPERIYFFVDEVSHEQFLKTVGNFNKGKNVYNLNDGWSLLKVDVSSLTNSPSFYLDPRMKNGVYTMDSISPENIEIIDYIKEKNND